MILRRLLTASLAGLLLLTALESRATDLTTVLNPGFFRLEGEADYNFLSIERVANNRTSRFEQRQLVYPLRMHYGLAHGLEFAATLPVSTRILSSSSDQNLFEQAWEGIGDLEGGTKFKFLSDTHDTPAIFVETLLKIPTGHSRFRDYVRALNDPDFAISGTDTATFDLILKGIFSMFLDPMELYMQLRVDVRGADDFHFNGVHEHVDYGNIISLSGGLEVDALDNLTLAVELLEISTEASVWLRDGENALALASDSSLLMAETRTAAGINLGNLTELYAGPALQWTFLPATRLKLSVLFGMTPDSHAIRAVAGVATTFNLGKVFDFKRGLPLLRKPSPPVSPAIADLPPEPAPVSEPSQAGNRRRFIKRRSEQAQKTKAAGDYSGALKAWKQISLQYPDYTLAEDNYRQLRIELDLKTQKHLDTAALALKDNNLLTAVRAWHRVLVLDPRNQTARGMLRDFDTEIREAAKDYYQRGVQYYVEGRYRQAIQTWQEGQTFDPKSPKLKKSINQTRRKMREVEKLDQ